MAVHTSSWNFQGQSEAAFKRLRAQSLPSKIVYALFHFSLYETKDQPNSNRRLQVPIGNCVPKYSTFLRTAGRVGLAHFALALSSLPVTSTKATRIFYLPHWPVEIETWCNMQALPFEYAARPRIARSRHQFQVISDRSSH